MNRLLLTLFIAISCTTAIGQEYASPVDFPITLAGNVGEIRSNHFHTGIDIKASKGVGSPIMAAADGYISRIGVSPNGYGRVLYVTHNDGRVSVYAHLNNFAKAIENWVEKQQYAQKSFDVNLYPPSDMFRVKQGQTIAALGNSGSSGGAHLHFEIRDKSGNPLNIVKNRVFKIVDNVSPNIYKITLYECDTVRNTPIFTPSQSIGITKNRSGQWEMSDTLLRVSRPFYVTYEVVDLKNGFNNTLGIYSLTQKVNGVEQFSFAIDRISFATTRYINTFVEYMANAHTRNHILRAYVSANNALSFYNTVANRGIIAKPQNGRKIAISTTINDDNGNHSTVDFTVVGTELKNRDLTRYISSKAVAWNTNFTYDDSMLQVDIAPRSLYDSALIDFGVDGNGVIRIGRSNIPLQKPINVQVKITPPANLTNKALLKNLDSKSVVSATWRGSYLEAKTSSMGSFTVVYDTIAPKITPLATEDTKLRWKVSDDLSGVQWYKLTVDGEWALAEWDPKLSRMSHRLKGAKEGKTRKIILQVSDNKGNITTSKQTIKW